MNDRLRFGPAPHNAWTWSPDGVSLVREARAPRPVRLATQDDMVDPDKDIRWFHYADNGIALYGNGVLVSPQLLKDKPEAVAGLVRAIHKGLRDTVADPDAAIDAQFVRTLGREC